MEIIFLYSLILSLLAISLTTFYLFYHQKWKNQYSNLPPGNLGWPLVGESLEFFASGSKGEPEKFVLDRISKYAPHKVFKTSILGENMVVLSKASGNKFLSSNEDKLVRSWWPKSVQQIFSPGKSHEAQAKKLRKLLPSFIKPEALQRYIPIMDSIAKRHFAAKWEGKDKVEALPLSKHYTFWLACCLFLNVEDPTEVAKFAVPFNNITAGIISIPINLPGTPFNRGIKAAKLIKQQIKDIIKQRRVDLAEGRATPNQDILSHMVLDTDEDGTASMTEGEIADKILGLLVGGHDTASTVCTLIVKYLAELPHIYDSVYKEQKEIAKSKGEGELLNWEDIQKMKYSWNVACEVMRLVPIGQGAFREALHDFSFEGYQIPKGWKLFCSTYSTQWNPEYFPEPEKFEPSRFEGQGPAPFTFMPFGGGPRMCPGKEYARLEILVFMHNLVNRFRWERLLPNEKIVMKLTPTPAKGLPIRLFPHTQSPLA